jgi:hypothetical protein
VTGLPGVDVETLVSECAVEFSDRIVFSRGRFVSVVFRELVPRSAVAMAVTRYLQAQGCDGDAATTLAQVVVASAEFRRRVGR